MHEMLRTFLRRNPTTEGTYQLRSEKERVRSDNYYLVGKAHSGRPIEFDEHLLIVLDGNIAL